MVGLQLLGTPRLTGPDGTAVSAVLTQPKRLALLAYLVLAEPAGFQRRDTLLAMFWPDLGDEEARRALRQALHFLRQHLGQDAIENRGTEEIALSRSMVACDVWAFSEQLRRGETGAALALARGELLAGVRGALVSEPFDQWLGQQRAGIERAVADARRRLGEPVPPRPSLPPAAEPPAGAQAPARPRLARWGAVLAVAAVAAALFLRGQRAGPPDEPGPDPVPRIAVAIFANRTQDTTFDQLGIIAAEWITRGLARVSGLDVLEPNVLYTRGRTPAGTPVDPIALARLSRSDYVVAGSYYRQGDGPLQLAAQVLDSTGRIVRTIDSVAAQPSDPLKGLETLRSRLSSAVHSLVDPRAVMLDAQVQSPPRYEAFQAFVQGQEAFWGTRYPEALAHVRRAASLDTAFLMAQVFTTVAAVSAGRCDLVDSLTPELEARRDRITEFERTTLGMSLVRCQRDWPRGLEVQRRRLALQPLSPVVRWTAASTFALANRPGEALAIYGSMHPERDLAWMAPLGRAAYWSDRAIPHHQTGDFTGERRLGERLAASGDGPLQAALILGRSLAALGDTAGARQALANLPAPPQQQGPGIREVASDHRTAVIIRHPDWVRAQVAAELVAHGHPGAADGIVTELEARLRRDGSLTRLPPVQQYAMGRAFLAAGKFAEARPLYESLVRLDTISITLRGTLGVIAARMGDTQVAEETRRWLEARGAVSPPGLPRYYLAAIAAAEGNIDRALDLVENLPYGSHPVEYNEFHVDPLLAPLRNEARFQRFIRPR